MQVLQVFNMRKDKDRRDHGRENEVKTARGRLEGALQILIERTESECSDESDVDVTDLLHEGRSMSASPRKVTKAPLRKRRKLDLEKVHKNDQHSYVLKLYDRSVDLAKFAPSTPLYPVCRAWIKNKPNSNNLPKSLLSPSKTLKMEEKMSSVELKEEITEDDKVPDVTELPMPEPMPKDDDGETVDTRIPSDLKPPKKSNNLDFLLIFQSLQDEEAGPSVQSLLQEHMTRWGAVRSQWRQAAALNETRYAESTKVLKSILVRP